jgi:NADPH:quinone reductase-like Zn-dependent oxidoreductase
VHASSVTRSDCGLRNTEYFFSRAITGLRRPKQPIVGMEFAGVVDEVGSAVTQFAAGEEVFGIKGGANAEYVCVRESGVIARKPSRLSFEQAAVVADGGLSALSMLPALGPIEGRQIVVYGASGSIGTAAVQVAKHLGATITAVCDTKHVELVRSLGADEVVDYAQEDWTRRGPYDGVFDAVGKSSFRKARRALNPGAAYVSADLGFMWHGPLVILATRWLGSRKAKLGMARYRQDDLLRLRELVDAGEYRPVIDRSYRMEDVVEAARFVETGQKTGNVVLTIA